MTHPSYPNSGRLPPPDPMIRVKRRMWLAVAVLIGFVVLALVVDKSRARYVLSRPDVIHFAGLALKVNDVAVRPLDDRFSVHADMTFLDRETDRTLSNVGFINEACMALLSSDMVGVPAERIFRVTFSINSEGSDENDAIVEVRNGRCIAYFEDGLMKYTMPSPLEDWIFVSWRGQRTLLGQNVTTLELIFAARDNTDPDLSTFDPDFACRVVFADWPSGVPENYGGRDWTQIKIVAREGVYGTFFSLGRSTFQTYPFDSSVCRGEAA